MVRDYEIDGDRLWERLNEHDPVKIGNYYKSRLDAFNNKPVIRSTSLFKEFSDLVNMLFADNSGGKNE